MNDAFYESAKWKAKRKQILRRDRYQCQLCRRYGKLSEAKIVHHKLELEEYPELAWADDNLISVCKACHNKLHDEKGTRSIAERAYGRKYDRYSGEELS